EPCGASLCLRSMVVDDLNVVRSLAGPAEADAVLVVQPDAVLPGRVAATGGTPAFSRRQRAWPLHPEDAMKARPPVILLLLAALSIGGAPPTSQPATQPSTQPAKEVRIDMDKSVNVSLPEI